MKTGTRSVGLAFSCLLAFVLSCARGPVPGGLAGWNVVLVTIDTLRADHVGFAGYDGASTPAARWELAELFEREE